MVFRNDNIWPALKDLSHQAEDGSQQRTGNALHFDISFFKIFFFNPLSGYWCDISCPWCPTVCYCLSASQACSIRKKLSRTFLNITGQSGIWKICRVSTPSASVLRRLREGLQGAQNNCFLMEQGLTNRGGGAGRRGAASTPSAWWAGSLLKTSPDTPQGVI